MEKNIIKFSAWQEAGGKIAFSSLAMIRMAFEKIRESETARKIAWVIIVLLAMTLEWIVAARIEHSKAQELYEQRTELFIENYISQQEAAERGMPIDPRVELQKQENEAFAKFIRTTQRFNFTYNDYVTAAWGMDARKRNPIYPDTFIEVLEQKGQYPYSENADVTKADYELAEKVLGVIRNADHAEVSSDYIYASFETEGVTLRDTWEITTKTHFWKWSGDGQ